ncbi:ferric-dicitrate binding protein FerR (iron transport regulator) [Streptomyces sp. V4I23]|uniref:hypothetical protein n=1 Tax=Streptomyces sp. V4I23 TaxID=3042282 RepID=UPI00277FC2C3|nr:hypothetical protein [Streptomyces sp. V4I23]MDQ1013067.1 ferric-dicitrate binding protein FerR (iron transport regulator) [Streptomyces sp. V4I23]
MNTHPDGAGTEKQLREALETLALQVQPDSEAYRTARRAWHRRERRRRLVLAVLATVVFALAVLIGLWVLNQTPSGSSVVFNGTHAPLASAPPAPHAPHALAQPATG